MKGRISQLTLSLLALSSFCTGFATTQLMDVYQQALQNDSAYKAAQATYLGAKESMPLAYANLLPTVLGTASYTNANNSISTAYNWTKAWGATLTQNVFNWSAFAGISEAKASVRGALATYQAARQALIQNTIAAYLTVVKDAATVEYDQTYSNELLEVLKQQKQKYNVGISAVTDVYKAQSAYDTQVATNIADKNILDSDIELLRVLTGQAYSSIKGVDASLPLNSPNPNDMEAWVNTALIQNLGIIGARAQVDIGKATVSSDVGANLPSLSLGGGYTQVYSANNAINAATANHNVSSVGLNLSVPIISGGKMLAQTHLDMHIEAANQQALDNTISSAVAATRTNYMKVMAAISGVQAAKQAYLSADKSLKATEAGYQVGTGTITDVLTAMSACVQAQESIVSNQVAYLNAIIDLKQEAGTLNDDDVQAISMVLSKTVVLPNTLSRKSYSSDNISNQATVTDKKHATKDNSMHPKITDHVATHAGHSQVKQSMGSIDSLPYSIQLFISKSEVRAKTFIQKYLSHDSDAYISSDKNHDQTFYAVMVGHYASKAQASSALSHLPASIQQLKPWIKKVS